MGKPGHGGLAQGGHPDDGEQLSVGRPPGSKFGIYVLYIDQLNIYIYICILIMIKYIKYIYIYIYYFKYKYVQIYIYIYMCETIVL